MQNRVMPEGHNMPMPEEHNVYMGGMNRRGGFRWKLVTLIIVIVLLVAGLEVAQAQGWIPPVNPASPNGRLYQAVFLTNGQVYFGKVRKVTRENLILTDIYYLQVVQPLQQKEPSEAQQNKEPALNLVKMGSEIHGPTDKMIIPKSNVVFWEDIKSDGTVAKAIDEFKNRKK